MKRKYYTHDYSLPSQVDRLLYDLQVKLREDKIDVQRVSKGIGTCRVLVDEYLSKDNLVEDEEGSLMCRCDEAVDKCHVMSEESKTCRYWFVCYHASCHNRDYFLGQTYVTTGSRPFAVKDVSKFILGFKSQYESVVILNYFEVDEETYLANSEK